MKKETNIAVALKYDGDCAPQITAKGAGLLAEITREMLDELYVNGRLEEKDLNDFMGSWQPS